MNEKIKIKVIVVAFHKITTTPNLKKFLVDVFTSTKNMEAVWKGELSFHLKKLYHKIKKKIDACQNKIYVVISFLDMIQLQTKPAQSVNPKLNTQQKAGRGRKKIPFDTSIVRVPEEEHATLNLTGTFTGTQEDFDTVEFAFLSQVIEQVPVVKLKVSATFHANGQKIHLAEAIATHAAKKGKTITFDNFVEWKDVGHVFHRN